MRQLGTLPGGALSAAAVFTTVGVRSDLQTFVKSDVMAHLSHLCVCGQTLQPFCVLRAVRLPSPPTSLKHPHAKQTTSWSIRKFECVHEAVMYSFAFIDPVQY